MDRKHNPDLTSNARNLRKNMTKEERHLWYDFLKCYPVRFLRQKVVDTYIVDFYCHNARLVIELDGSQHYDPEEQRRDNIRTEALQKRGLLVVRIPNNEVKQNFRGVCEYIDQYVRQRTKAPPCLKGGRADRPRGDSAAGSGIFLKFQANSQVVTYSPSMVGGRSCLLRIPPALRATPPLGKGGLAL